MFFFVVVEMHDHTNTPNHYRLWIFYIVSRGVHTKPKSFNIFSINSLCFATGSSVSISSLNSDQSHSIQYISNISMSDNFHISLILGSRNTHFFSHKTTSDFLYPSMNSCKSIGVFAMIVHLSHKKTDSQRRGTKENPTDYLLFYGVRALPRTPTLSFLAKTS